jgi:molecular chaperone Hsp33
MTNDDRLIQGMAAGGDFRILAAQTTHTLTDVRDRLDLSPVAATALGRAMTGAILVARLLDKHYRNQRVTLRFDGGGPLGVVIAEANVQGEMRGFVSNPQFDDATVNVGNGVGRSGKLTVVRATPPDGRPYTSQIDLANGEIATDLTHYLLSSEQINSAVLLGVMTRPSGITASGGLIVQAFPHASAAAVAAMEERIREAPPLSSLVEKMPIEEAVRTILHDIDYKQIDASYNVPLEFRCSCSRDRALIQFKVFDRNELGEIISEGGAEVTCQYCGQKYSFNADELLALFDHADA